MTRLEIEAEARAHHAVILPLYTEYMRRRTSKARKAEILRQIETLDLAFHTRMIPIYMAWKKAQGTP